MWDGSAWVLGGGDDSLEAKGDWNVDFRPEAIRVTGDSQGDTLYSTIDLVNESRIYLPNDIWNEQQALDIENDIWFLNFNNYSWGQKTITKIEFLCPGSPDMTPPRFSEYHPFNNSIVSDLDLMIDIFDGDSGVNWTKTVAEGNSVVNLDTGEPVVGGTWFSSYGLYMEYQSPPSIEDGYYRYTMTAEDNAGNVATHQLDVTVDTTPPVVNAFWGEANQNGPVYSPTAGIWGWMNEPVTIHYFRSTDNGTQYSVNYYPTDGHSWGSGVTDLQPGLNNFELSVSDLANNNTRYPITIEYILPIETPQNVEPADGQEVYSITPDLIASDYVNNAEIPQQASQWKITDPNDGQIPEPVVAFTGDNEYRIYNLPFVFPFMGRSIVSISVNSNGYVELLEVDESCSSCANVVCTSSGAYDFDGIFAFAGDLVTDAPGGVTVQDLGGYISIEWYGTTYHDAYGNELDVSSAPVRARVELYPSGLVNIHHLELGNWDNDCGSLFSAVNAKEESLKIVFPSTGSWGIPNEPEAGNAYYFDGSNPENPEWDYIGAAGELTLVPFFYDSGPITSSFTSYSVPTSAGLEFNKTYQWQVRYQDTSGNWSDWSNNTSFTTFEDTVPPDLSAIPSEIIISASQTQIVFTLEAGATVAAYRFGEEPLPATVVGQEWTVSVDTVAEGLNTIVIYAEDSAGNQSSKSISLYRDVAGPDIVLAELVDGDLMNVTPQSVRADICDSLSPLDLNSVVKTISLNNVNGNSTVDGTWEEITEGGPQCTLLVFTPSAPLADGDYTIILEAADSWANSSSVNLSFEIDTTPPEQPAFDPYSAFINSDSILLTGSKSADTTVIDVSTTGGTIGTLSYPSALTWQVLLSGLAEGDYTLTVQALDAAGNQSGSIQGDVTVDQTPPVISLDPVVASTKEVVLAITGTKEINSELYLDGQLVDGFFGESSWSVNVDLGIEGENSFSFNAQDVAGNVSDPVLVSVVRDTDGPVLFQSSPEVSEITNIANSLTISFNDHWSVVDYVGSLDGAELRGPVGVVAGSWTTDGSRIVFQPVEAFVSGQYTVNLYPVDSLGNSSVVAFVFRIDQTVPTALDLTMQPASPHRAETVAFTISFSETMDTAQLPVVTATGPGSASISGSWLNPLTWQGSSSFTEQTGDGNYTVSVSGARDVAGNEMVAQEVGSFVLDTVAPAVPVVSGTLPSETNQPTLPLSGTGEIGSQIVIGGVVRSSVDTSGTWSYNYSLAEGANTLEIVARDAAGNDSAPVAGLPVVVLDTTPPVLTLNPSPAVSAEQTLVVTGTTEAGATLKLDGTEFTDQDSDGDATTWAYSLTLAGTGLQEIYRFSAEDSQGNRTERTLTTTYDAAAPVALAAGALSADGNGNGQQVHLSWLYEEPLDLAYYRIYVASAAITDLAGLTPVGTVNRGSKAFTITGLTTGTDYHFAVEPVDSIGNSETTPVSSVAATPVDVEAPEEISNLSATAAYLGANDNRVTLRWDASANSLGDLAEQLLYTDAGSGYDAGVAIGAATTEYQINGLADNRSYKFKITTKDTGEHESSGVYINVVTALENPQGVSAAPGKNQVTLSWQAVTSPDLTLYKIYRQQTDQPFSDVSTLTAYAGVTSTSYLDDGLVNGTAYQYAVTAVNRFGAEKTLVASIGATPREDATGPEISGPQIVAGATLQENHVLTEPLSLTASASDSESSIGEVTLFIDDVEVASGIGSASTFWNLVATTDGTHTIKVQAFDSVGNMSERLRTVEVSLAAPSSDPADLQITSPQDNDHPSTDTLAVAGIAPQFTTLSLKVNGSLFGSTEVGAAGTFSFSAVPLISGTNSLQVMAAHRGGESAYSAPVQVIYDTGAPPAPTGLSAQALAGGQLQLFWQAADGEIPTGYNLYAATTSFSDVSALTPVNDATPLLYPFKEYQPQDDAPRYYAVTALDASGNESPPSALVQIASDRSAPQLFGDPAFIVSNQAANGAAGPGEVSVNLEVTEPLAEVPFFSLEPSNGSPIIITLTTDSEGLVYQGSFQISALSPHGPTRFNFSAKDAVGNRSNLSGTALTLDTRGPQATVSGLDSLQEAAGSVPITLSFDEVPQETPTLQFEDSANTLVEIPLTGIDSQNWSGSLPLDGLAAGYASFQLGGPLTDELGNSSSTIVAGASSQLYVGTPPAPSAPSQLAATTRRGGEISLVWQGVQDVSGYRLYRRVEGQSDLDWQQLGSDLPATANHYDDTPPVDGFYEYAVTALGPLLSESDRSPVAGGESDRTPPGIPDGLSLSLSGNGVLAGWNAVTDAYGYRLYQHDGSSRGNLVAEILSLQAVDPSPLANPQGYVVTAVDNLGNESTALAAQQIAFDVPPPSSLTLKQSEGGKPELSWTGSGVGYYIYRNGNRINSQPTTVTSYTDLYYSGEAVTYGVSLVDGNAIESPVRELTLPNLQVGLAEGTRLRRGILETIPVVLQADRDLSVAEVKLQVGSQTQSSVIGPYSLVAGQPLTVEKVAVAELSSQTSVGVLCSAVLQPSAGSRIEISRTSTALVEGAGTSLELFNQPLVRGLNSEVQIKINNLGSARMDLVTSRNGGASDQIRVLLKDEDGNLLGQASLNQRSGSQVYDTGSYATARIEPGESFLSQPISLRVPESAPYKVILEAQIDHSYYHYGQNDQVVAPGLQQKLTATIADVSYRPTVQVERAANAQGDKIFTQGEAIQLTGVASATADGTPMPHVPVRIGVAVNGFDRFYNVSSAADGSFSYSFQPGSNEVGHYSVWASHPDLSDRSVQDSFDVIAMRLTPDIFNLRIARGGSYAVPVKLTNLSGADLTGLTLTTTATSGLTLNTANLPANGSILGGNQTLSFSLPVSAAEQAPGTGIATLTMTTDQGLSRKLTVNVSCYDTIPIIATSPSFIDAGLKRGTQQIKTFSLSNTGLAELQNARITAPSLSWIKLAIDPNLGTLAVNESRSIGLLIQPPDTLAPGTYNDRIVIESDNHIPYTFNLSVTITSDAVGSVLFDVVDELLDDNGNYRDVVGASITLQNQNQPQLIYSLKTNDQGAATKTDIPEGRYSYTISAAGHRGYSGTVTVVPGLTVSVPIALEVTLVEVEWSVSEVIIEDRYEITITQTFETNVPTAVLVIEPPGVNIPELQPGEVYNGEFTITNYGLISADFEGVNVPPAIEGYEIELLGTVPDELTAMQRVLVPYRVTRQVE
jgi:fibronectin type 3 domain-containing protein